MCDWLIMGQEVGEEDTVTKFTMGHDPTIELKWKAQVMLVTIPFCTYTVREIYDGNVDHVYTVVLVYYETAYNVHVSLVLIE